MPMLQALFVRDFAIIEKVELEIDPGLTVLTGETGTGKSILIGALQLLLGDRASSDLVRAGASRSCVEGRFSVPEQHPARDVLERLGIAMEEDTLIARREITPEGRSRAFLNDTAVTVGALKEVGEHLVDLHGQHQHQSLLHPRNHLYLLDSYAGLDRLRGDFGDARQEYLEGRKRLETLRAAIAERAEQRDLLAFHFKEIEELDPGEGELEELERQIRILEGAERLAEGTGTLANGLTEGEDALVDRLAALESVADEMAAIDGALGELPHLLGEARVAMQEAAHGAQRYFDGIDFDRQRLEEARARRTALILLTRKYGGSMEAMLARREELREALREQAIAEEELPALEADVEVKRKSAAGAALDLSRQRAGAVEELQERVEAELHDLAMPDAEFRIHLERGVEAEGWVEGPDDERYNAGPAGIDRVEFHLRTNRGGPLLPLRRIASGGEISRVMLALKSVFGKASEVPTLVFDEIDSGIGGRTADRVGEKLEGLARQHQVVVITHLPQIARRGRRHLVVEKQVEEGTAKTRIRLVEGNERTRALAVLMGGDEGDETVVAHARELLGVAGRGETPS